jgi:hypothetical protein
LALLCNINIKTVQKWQKRTQVQDQICGAKKGSRSSLSLLEEEIVCQARLKTLLPLDDLYIMLKKQIPHLTRSNLHRCLQRNKVSRLGDILPGREEVEKKQFKDYPVGYLHMDTAEVHTERQEHYLFVAMDRTSKYAHVEAYDNKRIETSRVFLQNVIAQYPYKIHKILTSNGIGFTYELLPKEKRPKDKLHAFEGTQVQNSSRKDTR